MASEVEEGERALICASRNRPGTDKYNWASHCEKRNKSDVYRKGETQLLLEQYNCLDK